MSGPANKRDTPYLSQVPLDRARGMWFAAIDRAAGPPSPAAEVVAVPAATGRILAEPVHARFSSPAYHACAMDGYAVPAAATHGAAATEPRRLRIGAAAWPVDTGDPLPAGADAVVMIEEVEHPAADVIEIRAAAAPGQHVRLVGEDVAAGEMLLPVGWRLRGPDLAVLVAAGVGEVAVCRRPHVVIIPTGGELVRLADLAGGAPAAGQVIESNSLLAVSLATANGATAAVAGTVPDQPDLIEAALREALRAADVVVVSAGSSAGSGDHAAAVMSRLGEVVVHGVATRPGKPTILAVCAKKPVLGMPGYPVSAWLSLDNFLRPLLARLLGTAPTAREVVQARLVRRVPSPGGVREFLRARVGRIGDGYVASPLSRGAGVLTSLVQADGLVEVPEDREGYDAGAVVPVGLLRPRGEIDRTVVHIGSHDLALDVLADLLRRAEPGGSLSSANAGSQAGLGALARGEAHLAGTHLLDPATGGYNEAYVRRLLPGRRVALFCLALRQQGLLVAPGNPLGITGVADLARRGVRYINRQRGAGTRVLLDYLLRGAGLTPEGLTGYRREAYTHLAVAAEVAAGGADAGLGIRAAAEAAGLDFVPVAQERYELAIPAEHYELPLVAALRAITGGDAFRRGVEILGGYDTSPTGEVRWIGGER